MKSFETTTTKPYKHTRGYKSSKYQTTTQETVTELPKPHYQRKPRKGVGRRRKQFSREDVQCAVADCTEWSPCSVTCGKGYKIRTRIYLVPFIPNRVCDDVR